MAYIPNQEDENENQGQAAQGASGGPVLSSESASINSAAGGANPGAGTPGGASKPAGSGFVNLNKYITANQGNDAAMGQAVDKTVGGVAGQADTAASGYQAAASNNVASNTIKDTTGATDKVKGLASGNTWNGDDSQFSTLYNAQYKGPKDAKEADATGYDSASSAFANTEGYAKLADNNAGRKTLLTDTYKGPKAYNSGEKSLDSFILGGGQKGAEALSGIKDKWGNYSDKWKGVTGAIDNSITGDNGAIKTTDTTRNNFRQAVGGAQGSLEKDIEDATTKATTANTDAGAVSAGFTPEEVAFAASYGLSPDEFVQRGGNFGAGDFLDKPKVDNYAKLKALLSGADPAAAFKFDPTVVGKTGGKASTVNTDQVAGLRDARTLKAGIDERTATKQKSYLEGLAKTKDSVRDLGFLKSLGYSDEDLGMLGYDINTLDVDNLVDAGTGYNVENANTFQELQGFIDALQRAGGKKEMRGPTTSNTPAREASVKTDSLKDTLNKLLAPKKEAKRKADEAKAAKEEAARLQKILDDNAAIEKAKKEREEAIAAGNAFSQAYGMPAGYTPPQPANAGSNKTLDPVKGAAENPGNAIQTNMQGAGDAISNGINSVGGAIAGAAQPVVQDTGNKLDSGVKNLKKGKVKF